MPVSNGQVAIITGAASGIGRHLSVRMAAAGYRLFLGDANFQGLAALVAEQAWQPAQVQYAALDVRRAGDWQAAIDQVLASFGRLDILLNVAGVVRPGTVHESVADDIDFHLDINAKGTLLGTQLVARQMVAQKSGHIINIASMAALAAVPGLALYTASKFAVRGFSLAVAHELRPHGVALTVVCPDAVQTPMLDLQLDYPQAALTFSGHRPLTVEQLGTVILERVLPDRPLEVTVPRWRGWLAKWTSLWPALAQQVLPRLTAKGLQNQSAARDAQRSGRVRP